jgi:predicted metal-dependent peptidase
MELEEKVELLRSLQPYGNMYYTFLNMSNIKFTEEIPTLSISREAETEEHYLLKINPKFWESSTKIQKLFFISHECLHVMLSHLTRLREMAKNKNFNMELMNIAADLCVNEILIRHYKFIRSDVDIDNTLIWLDKVFPDQEVPYGMNMEYYYDLLMNKQKNMDNPLSVYGKMADDHGSWFNLSDDVIKEIIQQLDKSELEKLKNLLDNYYKNNKSSNKSKDSAYAFLIQELENKKVVKNKKWETIIHKWVKSKLMETESEHYQWAKKNRRFVTLGKNFFLPTISDSIKKEKEKITIAFFLDTSGSCHQYAQRFFDASKSVPLDRFDVRFFCFSTYVKEIDLNKNKLPMGGGTSFSIIEESIHKNFKKYPDAVFIITDGYGNCVSPKFPTRWFWFLTENNKSCFPNTCKSFLLKDYE